MASTERISAANSKAIFLYGFRFYAYAVLVSLGLFLVLPIVSVLLYVWTLLVLLLGIAVIAAGIGGGLYLLGSAQQGTQEQQSQAGCGCLILILVSLGVSTWFFDYGNSLWDSANRFHEEIMRVFFENYIHITSWIPAGLALLLCVISWVFLWGAKIVDIMPRMHYGKIHCPHADCGYSGRLAWMCPSCGTVVTNLRPTRYGIFSVQCPHCQARLGTSWFSGRSRCEKYCPRCLKSLNIRGIESSVTRRVILAGAPQSGKTSFMLQALFELKRYYPDQVMFTTDRQESKIGRWARSMSLDHPYVQPRRNVKRPEGVPLLFQKATQNTLVYFYDSTGAEFQSDATAMPFYDEADGILLFVDLFVGEKQRKQLGISSVLPAGFKPAVLTMDQTIGRLCDILEKVYGMGAEEKFPMPLGVVLTKMEMFGFYKKIDPELFTSGHDDQNHQNIQAFLQEHGFSNALEILEARFSKYRFFATSAYENYPMDDTEHSAVLAPAEWMLRQIGGL